MVVSSALISSPLSLLLTDVVAVAGVVVVVAGPFWVQLKWPHLGALVPSDDVAPGRYSPLSIYSLMLSLPMVAVSVGLFLNR